MCVTHLHRPSGNVSIKLSLAPNISSSPNLPIPAGIPLNVILLLFTYNFFNFDNLHNEFYAEKEIIIEIT